MNTKNNQQYRRSALLMENAMLALLNKLPPDKITVSRICQEAGVNRSTFYAHYLDIPDMLEQMEDNLHREWAAVSGSAVPYRSASLIPFLTFIKTHKDFYRAVLGTRREFPLKQGKEALWKDYIVPVCRSCGITDEKEMICCFAALQASFTVILEKWVNDGCLMSVQETADIISRCLPEMFRD